jgi:hypothetical protein
VTYDIVLLEPRKFILIPPAISTLSRLAQEFVRLNTEYEALIDSGFLINLTPEDFLRKQGKIKVLGARLTTPEMVEGMADYTLACQLLRIAHESGLEEARAEKVRQLVELHKEYFGEEGFVVAPPSGVAGRTS